MIRVPTFAVCLAVSLFQTAHCQISVRAKNPAVFGTNTGYDAGGEDPVCWVSELSYQDTLPGTVTSDVEVKDGRLQQLPRVQIKDLDDLLFSRAFDSSELLQTCGAATTLAIHVLSEDLVFDAGKSYDFSVEMLLKNISDLHASYYGRESVLLSYSRVVLCNTLENRFCTPIFPQPLESYTVANTTSFVTAGDSSVVSGWEILDFDGEISSNSTYNIFSNHRVALPGNISGTFFAIGHVVTSIISQHKLIRYDVANAVSGGVITIRRPPKVREVTTGAKIGLACLVAISASFALYILVYLVVRRNEAIIQLAQGKFLAAISAGCLLQIVSSFVFLPTNSLYCDLFGLLILFPMTFVASCLVGRVWRVHKTLSIAQTMGRQRTKQEQTLIVRMEGSLVSFLDRLARIPLLQCRSNSRINGRRSLRETVTDAQTTGLIAMLALPQLSFQIYVLSIGRRVIYIEDALGTVSRLYCDQAGRWTSAVGLAYMITILMLAVAMGWVSRFLPSAFNEKSLIFQAASVSTFLAVLSIMMWRPITDAGTAPDLSVSDGILSQQSHSQFFEINALQSEALH